MDGVPPPSADAGGYSETAATDGDPAGVPPPAAEVGYPDTVGESEGPAASLGDAG